MVPFVCAVSLMLYANYVLGRKPRKRLKVSHVHITRAILLKMEGARRQKKTFGSIADLQR